MIDINFMDASIYSVRFCCKKNKQEHSRAVVIPSDWDRSQVEKEIRGIFNETILVLHVDWVSDVWIPKSLFI